MVSDDSVSAAARLVTDADALLVCAGAGVGVDSGLPDFRGDHGFWRAYPPYERLGLSFSEIADPVHFADDPTLAWGFYGHRLALYRRTRPHPGFGLLRKWGERTSGGVRTYTSNVDGQFQKDGYPAESVVECHGSIHRMQCLQPCTDDVWSAEDVTVTVDEESMRAREPLPACRNCGGVARPNIAMFGDWGWVPERTQERLDELTAWRRSLRSARLVVIELGAGTALPVVRRYAELASAGSGALIRINPREAEVRHGRGVSLATGSLEALSAIDAAL